MSGGGDMSGLALPARMVRAEEDVGARRVFQLLNVRVNDLFAEEVEVEVILSIIRSHVIHEHVSGRSIDRGYGPRRSLPRHNKETVVGGRCVRISATNVE